MNKPLAITLKESIRLTISEQTTKHVKDLYTWKKVRGILENK